MKRQIRFITCKKIAAVLVIFITLLSTPAYALNLNHRITNSFFDTDLRQALSDISMEVGIPIIAAPEVSGFISCDLQDVRLIDALEMLLAGTEFVVVDRGKYLFVTSVDPESPSFIELSDSDLIKINYGKAEDIYKMLPAPIAKYVHMNGTQNTLSVLAPPNLLKKIKKEIAKLDTPQLHVKLDAMIVAMLKQDLMNLGIQWGFPTAAVGAFTNDAVARNGAALGNVNLNMFGLQWPWGAQLGYSTGREFTNALTAKLNMLAQNDDATIIASPQVLAQDGKEAKIEVITEEYFEILTQGIYTNSKLEKIDSGTILSITPLVNNNGEITLDINTEVSDIVSRQNDELPVVTRRKASTTVRVKDGGTVAIAGLLDSRTSMSDEEVPGFADIPGLGEAFKNNGSYESQRQLAVFITARVLHDPGAPEEKQAMQRPILRPISEEVFVPLLKESLRKIKKEFRRSQQHG